LGLRYCETNNRSETTFGADTKTVRTFLSKDRKKDASFIVKTSAPGKIPRRKYGVWGTRPEPNSHPVELRNVLANLGIGELRYQNFLAGFFAAGA
jgi:hypothetical protein